jgi:seryl-tRNA synthetase
MAEENPTGSDPGARQEPTARRYLTCEGCESTLHANGEMKKKSDLLKEYEKSADIIASLRNRISELEGQLTELRTQPNPMPAPSVETAKKKHLNLSFSFLGKEGKSDAH